MPTSNWTEFRDGCAWRTEVGVTNRRPVWRSPVTSRISAITWWWIWAAGRSERRPSSAAPRVGIWSATERGRARTRACGPDGIRCANVSLDDLYMVQIGTYVGIIFSVIDCGRPADIENGRVIVVNDSTVYGGSAEYHCVPHYNRIGPYLRKCMDDGKWSGEEPRCECEYLGEPMGLNNSVDTRDLDSHESG